MKDLEEVGTKLLNAAYAYWEASHKAGIDGAVIWLQDTDGKLVIFTRGEYRATLMQNIERIGAVRAFGSAGGDEPALQPSSEKNSTTHCE